MKTWKIVTKKKTTKNDAKHINTHTPQKEEEEVSETQKSKQDKRKFNLK